MRNLIAFLREDKPTLFFYIMTAMMVVSLFAAGTALYLNDSEPAPTNEPTQVQLLIAQNDAVVSELRAMNVKVLDELKTARAQIKQVTQINSKYAEKIAFQKSEIARLKIELAVQLAKNEWADKIIEERRKQDAQFFN